MAAPAHLPPAALDHSSLPTRQIATELKHNVRNYLNSDHVDFEGLHPFIRYQIVSTTVEGQKSVKMAVLTTTMALNIDSSGFRGPYYSMVLIEILIDIISALVAEVALPIS